MTKDATVKSLEARYSCIITRDTFWNPLTQSEQEDFKIYSLDGCPWDKVIGYRSLIATLVEDKAELKRIATEHKYYLMEQESKGKNVYGMKNITISTTSNNTIVVKADTKRFGDNAIMFEGRTFMECCDYIRRETGIGDFKLTSICPNRFTDTEGRTMPEIMSVVL